MATAVAACLPVKLQVEVQLWHVRVPGASATCEAVRVRVIRVEGLALVLGGCVGFAARAQLL